MKYMSAYLLAALSGNDPTKDQVKSILGSVGIDVEESRVEQLFSALEGKQISELIEEGTSKLASMPVGGAAAAPAGGAAASGDAAAPAEEKKEEEEESDDDMGFGLFD